MSKNMIICGVGVEASSAKWTAIAVVGKWKGHIAGEFELTQIDLEQIVTNFSDAKSKDVVVDFEHQSTENIKAEATGWAVDLKVENSTLFAKVEWLAETKELIKSKKYKYLSPVLIRNTLHPITGENIGWSLHSIALTNTPFFQELDEVILNKRLNRNASEALNAESYKSSIQNKEKNLNEDELKELEQLRKEKKTWEDETQKLKDEIDDLKKTNAQAKVDEAVAAKKIHPDQKESMLAFSKADPISFDKFLASAKPTTYIPGSNDMFANSQDAGGNKQKYDVLKMGGIE